MIKNINKNVPTFYPDVKTYIEVKSQIDVKHLAKVVSDKVELSDDAKNAAQDQYGATVTPKPEKPTPQTADVPAESLDTYF